MIGQRVIVEAGKRFNAAFQARVYLGLRSMMLVGVGEAAELSPSAEMEDFLNNSVSRQRGVSRWRSHFVQTLGILQIINSLSKT